MATIDDFGSITDPLSNPQLGGNTGWAAAIRDAVRAATTMASNALTPAKVVAGAGVTVDRTTTPGSVILSTTSQGSPNGTLVYRQPDGLEPPGSMGAMWLVDSADSQPETFATVIKAIPGLVAYYPLDATYTTTDVVGGRNATNVGAVTFADNGATFKGTNYLEIADASVFSVPTTGELTIVAFQTVTDWTAGSRGADTFCHWMGKGEDTVGNPDQQEWVFRHYFDPDISGENPPRPKRTSIYAFNPAGGLGAGSYFEDPDPAGAERMITGMIWGTKDNGGSTQIWKNGILRDTDLLSGYNITPTNGTAPVRIGTRDFGSYFIGRIRHVAFFNRRLTQAELLSLYNARNLPTGNWAGGVVPDTFFGSIKDDFTTGFGAIWTTVNNATVVNGEARIATAATAGSRINTNFAYTLRGSSVAMKMSAPVDPSGGDSANTYTRARIFRAADTTTMLDVIIRPVAGTISFRNVTANTDANPGQGVASMIFDPIQHAWIRFRESGGTVYWETSPDGAAWVVRRADNTPAWLTATPDQRLYIETLKTTGAATYAVVDKINLGPATTGQTALPLRVYDGTEWVQVGV